MSSQMLQLRPLYRFCQEIRLNNVVSNPPSDNKAIRRDRLIVNFLNRRQLVSHIVSKNRTIGKLRTHIAVKADLDPATIRNSKFIHVCLDPATFIGDVTKSSGANFFCHCTNPDKLDYRTAYLVFGELGLTPNISPTGQEQAVEPEEN